MTQFNCNHCNNSVDIDDKKCPRCGMPLLLKQRASPQRKFIIWFIIIVIFSFAMMLLLPWFGSSELLGR